MTTKTKPITLKRINVETMPTKGMIRCLRAFHRLLQRNGEPPTQRQVAEEMGISESGAVPHINGLVERGLLTELEVKRVRRITAAGEKWL